MKIRLSMYSLAVGIVLLDQVTKYWISQTKPYVNVIPGFFNVVYVENTGAAFGIFQGRLGILSLISLAAMTVLAVLIWQGQHERKGMLLAFALILGGTCGNLIDRVRLKYVVDFLEFYIKTYRWPSFNIADSAISTGVALLILLTLKDEFLRKKSTDPTPENQQLP
ncbi:lipoprotein signal peptidase [Candidatus Moduliflexus flocculans]|uniref:Lipoprotein signal peptidase n=1 Tax=Candidatus Moduliflexus flocculans TaxID=1499966 RepID=A0A0S6W0Z8_9BACT|nr:lipoprotein signal peptidase [Candidatus Moduliflexus flocculans]